MLACARSVAMAFVLGAMGCAETTAARGPDIAFASEPAAFSPSVEARIRNVEGRASVRARMQEFRVPGLSVAVINGGVVEWARGYGVLEAGGARVTQDTLFQAASVSKPVTALAALRLVQDGYLELDDDVNRRLSSWRLPDRRATFGRAVTLRELLSHSAGVNIHGFRGYARGEHVPSLLEVLDGSGGCNSGPIHVDAVPGERWRYSGGGYVIVQQLLSDVTREPFDEMMNRLVLGPLGMVHSMYAQPLPRSLWPYAAAGHREDGAEIRGRWFTYPELSAAGLWTTPSDLARFVVEIENAVSGRRSRLLGRTLASEMLTRQLGPSGLGVMLSGSGRTMRFTHGGSNQGFRVGLVGFPYLGQGAVVMSNADAGGQVNKAVMSAIAAEYGWPEGGRGGEDVAIEDDVDLDELVAMQ